MLLYKDRLKTFARGLMSVFLPSNLFRLRPRPRSGHRERSRIVVASRLFVVRWWTDTEPTLPLHPRGTGEDSRYSSPLHGNLPELLARLHQRERILARAQALQTAFLAFPPRSFLDGGGQILPIFGITIFDENGGTRGESHHPIKIDLICWSVLINKT